MNSSADVEAMAVSEEYLNKDSCLLASHQNVRFGFHIRCYDFDLSFTHTKKNGFIVNHF